MSETRYSDRLPEALPSDPLHWADAWLKEALAEQVQRNANSMSLATLGADGQPSSRVVLCKQFVPDPGYLVFYTNYRSKKGADLAANPRAAALFHWDALGRQIRLEGQAVQSPAEENDAYFATRDPGSKLGAWGSDQSQPIESHQALVEQIGQRGAELGIDPATLENADADVPDIRRPDHWGGYRLWATAVELWIEGRDRIHDRARWERDIVNSGVGQFTTTPWSGTRLQP